MSIQLSKISKRDGRWLLLFVLIVYFLPVLVASLNNYQQWDSPWIYPGVPWKMLPPFSDMRVITSGYECMRKGYNVLIENPCDLTRWQRPMNYPPIWLLPAFLEIDQSHTLFLGVLFGLLFFIFVFWLIGRLNYFEIFIYTILLCSPSMMFAIERGNNDLIIFSLLSITLLLFKNQNIRIRIGAYFIILFAAILKLYPIFAITTIWKEKNKKIVIIPITIIVFFSLYLLLIFDSLKLVSEATPRATFASYGGMVVFDILVKRISNSHLFTNSSLEIIKIIISLLIIFLVFIFAYLIAKRINLTQEITCIDIQYIDGFRMGSSIYIGTYILGNNWDYRLIFLLFTIPQILRWISSNSYLAQSSSLVLIDLGLSL